jgi:methionine sulfoxide reductase heme-binding subunit
VVRLTRFWKRMFAHHLPLFVTSAVVCAALYVTRPFNDVITRLSFATAYPALILMAFALLIGPWKMLRGEKTPVSIDLRRDVGIWAGILGILHAVVGQCVHLRGRPWLYYVYEHRRNGPTGLRHDLFGFNNYTGLVATLILIALFATSNDLFLGRLGAQKWKQLQRWSYVSFALTAAHAIGYQTMEKQKEPFVLTAVACIVITLCAQMIGIVKRRRMPARA